MAVKRIQHFHQIRDIAPHSRTKSIYSQAARNNKSILTKHIGFDVGKIRGRDTRPEINVCGEGLGLREAGCSTSDKHVRIVQRPFELNTTSTVSWNDKLPNKSI